MEARSRNHCSRGKATSITYSEGKSVDFVVYYAMRMAVLYCHLWPVWLYHIFHIIYQKVRFSVKVTENKMCILIFPTTFVY